MTALLRAELLKLHTRAATGLLVATLALVALTVVVNVPKASTARAPVHLNDPCLLASVVGIGAGFVVMAAYAVIGVAVGALVRNQIVAVVGVLVWMLVVEQIVIPTYPLVGRWLPGGAADAWLQLGPALDLDGRLPPAPLGGLVLIVYTALVIILARKLTLQRDVL